MKNIVTVGEFVDLLSKHNRDDLILFTYPNLYISMFDGDIFDDYCALDKVKKKKVCIYGNGKKQAIKIRLEKLT